MLLILLLAGMTFIQNNVTHKSDIVEYQTEKNYTVCDVSRQECPNETQKALKEKTATEIPDEKLESHKVANRKFSIPLEEIQKGVVHVNNSHESNRPELLSFYEDSNGNKNNVDKNNSGNDSSEDVSRKAEEIPLDSLLTPAKDKSIDESKPFAIKPSAYYQSKDENVLVAKLTDIENKAAYETSEGRVIDRVEIKFGIREGELLPEVSGLDILKTFNNKFKFKKVRITGFGSTEKEVVDMVLMVLEQVDETILLDDIRSVPNEERKTVLVEVLDEV